MKTNKDPVTGEKDYANWHDINFACDCKSDVTIIHEILETSVPTKVILEIYCGECFEDFKTLDDLDRYDYERNIRIKNGFKP